MKTLIIDNYDSFTYNLYQLVGELGGNPVVKKNDETDIAGIKKINPSHIIISPGPGTVENKNDFGIGYDVINEFTGKIPVLGVCLGHQGIAKSLGGTIERTPEIMHGKTSTIRHSKSVLFNNIPETFTAMRYHSLCASRRNFPTSLKITAVSEPDEVIMAFEHCKYPLFGIQFHPESFMTDFGRQIILNFLSLCC